MPLLKRCGHCLSTPFPFLFLAMSLVKATKPLFFSFPHAEMLLSKLNLNIPSRWPATCPATSSTPLCRGRMIHHSDALKSNSLSLPHYKGPTGLNTGPMASSFHVENPIFSLFLFVSLAQGLKSSQGRKERDPKGNAARTGTCRLRSSTELQKETSWKTMQSQI